MPSPGAEQFLECLQASRLVSADVLARMSPEGADGEESLASRLIAAGNLTEWQVRVLESGAAGPFHAGEYLLLDRLDRANLEGCFSARHLPSGCPALLAFYDDSNDPSPLAGWTAVSSRYQRLAEARHPHLLEVFEAVTSADYLFVASEYPTGKTLAQLLPAGKKSRAPQTCQLGSQIAGALAAVHATGQHHGQVGLDRIWLSNKESARLQMPVQTSFGQAGSEAAGAADASGASPQGTVGLASAGDDLFDLGRVLFRMLTGAEPPGNLGSAEERAQATDWLTSEKTPEGLVSLVMNLMSPDPSARPSADKVATRLAKAAGGEVPAPPARPASYLKLREQIRKAPGQQPAGGAGNSAPDLIVVSPIGNGFPGLPGAIGTGVQGGSSSVANKPAGLRRRKSVMPIVFAVSSLFSLVALALIVWMNSGSGGDGKGEIVASNGGNLAGSATGENAASSGQPEDSAADSSSTTDAASAANRANGAGREGENRDGGAGKGSWLDQRIVPDDGKQLWESPTAGPPLDLTGLPPAPRMVFSIRCAGLLKNEEGARALRSGGERLGGLIERLREITGLGMEEIDQLLVGVYPAEDPLQYDYFLVARLVTPAPITQLQNVLALEPLAGQAAGTGESGEAGREVPAGQAGSADAPAQPATSTADGLRFRRGNVEVVAWRENLAQPAEGEAPVRTLLFGESALVDAALESGGRSASDGAFERLATFSDDQRLIQGMVVPAALFNDAGQAMLAGPWSGIFQRLQAMTDGTLRAAAFAVHLDQDCYLELVLEHSVDTRPEPALESLQKMLKQLRADGTAAVAGSLSHPWWERVRLQLDNMLTEAWRRTRTGIEGDMVLANCWLPQPALHNLLAAGEIALAGPAGSSRVGAVPGVAGTSGAGTTTAAGETGPKNLDELLAKAVDLEVSTNPDLGLLLEGLETDINDQNRNLPFRFVIRMEGNDLLRQGITQNQRPGSFSIRQKPLSEVLTEIVFRANPNKTATGPDDPACELVWLVEDDPDQPGVQRVLISTRTAVTERKLQLPPQFLKKAD